MKTYVSLALAIVVATTVQAQELTSSDAQRAASLRKVLSQLSLKVQPEQLRNVQVQAAKWQQTKTEKDWIEATDAVYKASKHSDAKSKVTISSSGGNGATVKYQTLGERKRGDKPTTAKELTVAHEEMYVGMYHIWSERGGSPTSDKDAQFDIPGPEDTLKLEEKK